MKNQATFSPCQELALERLNQGQNIFLTGGAGTGKSFLIRKFLADKSRKTFPVLASTGAAAVIVGGRTFHSFFGLGIMEGGVNMTVMKALKNRRVIHRLKKIEGFVLDEISMISGPTLRAAEQICRLGRDSEEPWGGLKVIAVGDFAQLPPVQKNAMKGSEWAFNDAAWRFSKFEKVALRTMMRTQDLEFLEVLEEVRYGKVTESVRDFLNQRSIDADQDFEGPRLFPRRNITEQYNLKKLDEIENPVVEFPTVYSGKPEKILQLKKMAPIPEILYVKKDCLVMLRQNDPQMRWVNGSLGMVKGFEKEVMLIELMNGRLIELEKSSFTQLDGEGEPVATAENYPVTLAYATTIHKAQGATYDRLRVDLKSLWEPGQAYVALSRVTSSEGLVIDGWNEDSIRVDPQVLDANFL